MSLASGSLQAGLQRVFSRWGRGRRRVPIRGRLGLPDLGRLDQVRQLAPAGDVATPARCAGLEWVIESGYRAGAPIEMIQLPSV